MFRNAQNGVPNGTANGISSKWEKHVPRVVKLSGPRKLSEDSHDIEVSYIVYKCLFIVYFY